MSYLDSIGFRTKPKGFNIYFPKHYDPMDPGKNLYCPVHAGVSLVVKNKEDPSSLICPQCGISNSYLEKESRHATSLQSKFGDNQTKRKLIIQGKSRIKKLYSEQGDKLPIEDTLIQQEISEGKRIISYKEDVPRK